MDKHHIKEYRKILRERGVCTRCMKRDAAEGRVLCKECVVILNKKRDEKRAEGGRCRECLTRIDHGGICERCREGKARHKRNMRKRRAEAGLCINCGGPLDNPNLKTCINCQDLRTYHKRLARSWV